MTIHCPRLRCSQSNNFQIEWKGKKKTKHRNTSRDATVQLQINYRHSFRFWKLTSAAFLVPMFPATDIFTEVGERNKTGKVVNCLSPLQVLGIVFSFSQSKTQVSLDLFPWIQCSVIIFHYNCTEFRAGDTTGGKPAQELRAVLRSAFLSSVCLRLLLHVLNRLLCILSTDYVAVVCAILNLPQYQNYT